MNGNIAYSWHKYLQSLLWAEQPAKCPIMIKVAFGVDRLGDSRFNDVASQQYERWVLDAPSLIKRRSGVKCSRQR